MSDDDLYRKAEQRADAKIGFYHHLIGFIVANLFLFAINAIFSWGDWWFYWITVFWGIGLIIHFLKVFVFAKKIDGDYREKMIEKEMEKMKK